jgi:hypothetical protein
MPGFHRSAETEPRPEHGSRLWPRVAVSVGAALVVIVHLAWPQVSFDTFAVVLLGLIVLPWIGDILDSIQLPGGMRARVRKLQEEFERTRQEVRGESQAAARKSEDALVIAIADADDDGLSRQLNSDPRMRLAELAAEYDALRKRPKGARRSAEMTRLVGKMMSSAARAHAFDVPTALRSDDPGVRLTGYSWLVVRPDPQYVGELIDVLTGHEESKFNQYWAIRALNTLVEENDPEVVTPSRRAQLKEFTESQPPASDRRYELTRALKALGLD